MPSIAPDSSISALPGAPVIQVSHVALWTRDLERLRIFYTHHFGSMAGPKYTNAKTGFSSYFLSFGAGPRIEIMARGDVHEAPPSPVTGYAHLAFSVGSEGQVRVLTERLRNTGVTVLSEPRRTGDGYFESVVQDPDGNPIEITV